MDTSFFIHQIDSGPQELFISISILILVISIDIYPYFIFSFLVDNTHTLFKVNKPIDNTLLNISKLILHVYSIETHETQTV